MTGHQHLHMVPAAQPRPVRLPGETVADAIDRTRKLLARYGAHLELAVADGNGAVIPVNMVEADLPEQLRVQAIAVFGDDRADVVGQSDPIERAHYRLYEHTIEWLQALGALRTQFNPAAVTDVPVPGGHP